MVETTQRIPAGSIGQVAVTKQATLESCVARLDNLISAATTLLQEADNMGDKLLGPTPSEVGESENQVSENQPVVDRIDRRCAELQMLLEDTSRAIHRVDSAIS